MEGRFQIYCGEGKGKTTAALGLCLRAAGAGLHIYFGQFLKPPESAEVRILRDRFADRICYEAYGPFHFIRQSPTDHDRTMARNGFIRLRAALLSGRYEVVVGDEALAAVSAGLLLERDLVHLAEERPAGVELVLTGRQAGAALIERADLVTEMRVVKHYFDRGTPARPGIEY